MVSSPRNLLVACSLALACLSSADFTYGQIYGQQVFQSPASLQGYDSTVIIDHSSMSPDSWSAPAISSSPEISTATPNAVLPSSSPVVRSARLFQPATNNAITSARSGVGSSPSIPDLNGTATSQSVNQINSLIRQPGVGSGNSNNVARSPFQSAKYRMGGQDGPSLTTPDSNALSNTLLPAYRNPSTLPPKITSATGRFDTGAISTPAITSGPLAASSTLASPNGVSPAFGQPATQVAPDRYPLGINGGLPAAAATIRVLPDNAVPAYQALTTETQVESPGFPRYGASSPAVSSPALSGPALSGPAFSQSIFQQQPRAGSPVFRPDLGHLAPNPTFRGRDHDSGLKMDFEDKKKEYPGIGEILATGRYFGSVSALYLQPAFQNNSAITQFNSSVAAASFTSSDSFDFDYEAAPRLRLGFESKFGPGVELDYFQFDPRSNTSSFTSNGLNSGQLSTGQFGPSGLTTLEAVNAGEQLSAVHSIDIETFSIMFFKEIKFPISRLNGMFGFQYASIFQTLEGELTDAGGAVIGSLRSTSDLRAYGPKFKFEYYRPIGHTKLEFVTAFGGGVLFGERDQIVSNTGSPAVNRFGADEFIVSGDFYGGVQWKKLTAENRAYYARVGITHQSWIGGGTAVDAQDNFGLRGFAFEVGINR